jgi:hypothetical protein
MLRRVLVVAACAVGGALLLAGPVRADPPFRFPEGKFGTGELKYRCGLPVLTVAGTPEEIGTAAGVLALNPGRRVARYPEEVLRNFFVGYLYWPALKVGQGMVEQFPSDYRAEFEALANVGCVERDHIVVANTLFDLKKIVCCSALLVEPGRSATGGTLMGRNLDFPTLGYLQEYSLVTVYRPQGVKHNFATVGFPGLVGCLSGMNDAGLAVAVLEVSQVRAGEHWFDINGLCYGLCYRRILEECATVAEAFALLSQMKRTSIGNLAVADREGVAVFEITPQRVIMRRTMNGTTICTNHFCAAELKPRVQINWFTTLDRFATLDRLAQVQGKLGTGELQMALHAVSGGDTMQTMVFEPGTLRLHLAIGAVPSSALEMRTLDLGPLLRGQVE